jgi:hypothetical protein
MWIHELESIYSENLINEYHNGISIDTTPHTKNVPIPIIDYKTSMKNVVVGTDPGTAYNQAMSQGSNQPFEQEEEPVSKEISSHIEDAMNKLDPSSQQHAHTYHTLQHLYNKVKEVGQKYIKY